MWLNKYDFAEKYNLTINNINVQYCKKTKPEAFKKKGRMIYVNESYLLDVAYYRSELYNKAHDLYYAVLEKNPDCNMVKLLTERAARTYQNWRGFLLYDLFKNNEYSILNTNIPKRLLDFIDAMENYLKEFDG